MSCLGWRASATLETSFMSTLPPPPPLLSALCLFCGLQAAWHPTSVSVCLFWLTTEKICSIGWIARTRVFPLFRHLSHPHTEIPLVQYSFNSIFLCIEEKAWWGTPATPFLALHIRRKTPRLSDEGEFFWLCNELHIPNGRPGVAQLGPIKGWMKSCVASSCRLMDGIPSWACIFLFFFH